MTQGQAFEIVALCAGHYRLSAVRAKTPLESVVKLFDLDTAKPVAEMSAKNEGKDIIVNFDLRADAIVRFTHILDAKGEAPTLGSLRLVRRSPSCHDLLFCCAHPSDQDYDDIRFHLTRFSDGERTAVRPVFDDPRDMEARVAAIEARLLSLKGRLT